jgi:hypothetical protein
MCFRSSLKICYAALLWQIRALQRITELITVVVILEILMFSGILLPPLIRVVKIKFKFFHNRKHFKNFHLSILSPFSVSPETYKHHGIFLTSHLSSAVKISSFCPFLLFSPAKTSQSPEPLFEVAGIILKEGENLPPGNLTISF